MGWRYLLLKDREHAGQIVRVVGRVQQEYLGNKWVDSAIMMHYFTDISPLYDLYEEITEEEAGRILGKEALQIPA